VYLTLLFSAATYLVGAVPYDPYQHGTAIIMTVRFAMVGEKGQLTGHIQ